MATDRETGFYCSTSGTYFSDKESLAEHYKSDFHRYNLKRKVAGLPPVTKEWFEARKAQLSTATASTTPNAAIWFDPLTKKKFQTQNTYQAHVKSKKYQDLVKASGEPAPAPIIMMKQQQQQPADGEAGAAAANGTAAAKPAGPAGFTVKAPHRGGVPLPGSAAADDDESDAADDDSGWETESDEEAATAAAADAAAGSDDEADAEVAEEDWQEWDVCVSLFDNKRSASMQANLEYMYKHFGFYLPDSEFLTDPEGLLKYLGAKLAYGKVPLHSAGDDANAKQFRSLHAVQRHMVDTNQCRMLYDGSEDEYEDFYDYSAPAGDASSDNAAGAAAAADGSADSAQQLSTAMNGLNISSGSAAVSAGWELAVPAGEGSAAAAAGKVLGSREMAKYYRQKPKPIDSRRSVAAGLVVAQYRALGVETLGSKAPPAGEQRAQRERQRQQRQWLNLAMRTNINRNLPKNVPY
ncbi:hypothetical protein OEZ85_005740 [Tetradesmus obliquus]|uniref:ZN622/Rei1/Reh1 zinc finger C2H2-type domain-containing protein n=1 Tax=Tetradesmus obliquus TaxID=3088 RepID=A0ABY8UHN4_TETOB|nr:hypothetical protein OEZ85_005740 [Tetradesmus obliquus]